MPKIPMQCTADDAEVLALYASLTRGTVAHSDFVSAAIGIPQ
jgi:hypothetical protein